MRADRLMVELESTAPWVPGTNMVMSAHEAGVATLAPPQ
jgi:hypothetical protein